MSSSVEVSPQLQSYTPTASSSEGENEVGAELSRRLGTGHDQRARIASSESEVGSPGKASSNFDDSEAESGSDSESEAKRSTANDSHADLSDHVSEHSGQHSEDGEREDRATDEEAANEQELGTPNQQELFGDADDVDTSADEDVESATFADVTKDVSVSSPEERTSPEPVEETLIDVEVPKISVDLGSHIHFVKFPNFLSVEPRMFDPDAYEDEVDEDEVLDEEGRSRLKLKVENTIRWRNAVDDQGNVARESNARVVRWSDGSMSLYLGAEVFDVHMHPLQGDHHHLFIRQGTGLQGRALFRTKLTFRPHSIESFTHRKMTLSMADRNNKTQKVKVLSVVGVDPETQKQELLKREEERLRATARRESQQRRMKERSHMRGLSAGYLEPDRDESDEDEGAVSISAIKRRYKTGAKQFIQSQHSGEHSGAESDESDDSARQKTEHTKRLESDDDEIDDKPKKRAKVIEESDDDDDS